MTYDDGAARMLTKTYPWWTTFFVVYVMVVVISILNVIVALIVDSTLKQTLMENEHEKMRLLDEERQEASQKLVQLFKAMDCSRDGHISKEEWKKALLEDEKTQEILASLGLPPQQTLSVYDVLDTDESGSLNLKEFVPGILNGRGQVRIFDIWGMQSDLWRAFSRMQKLLEALLTGEGGGTSSTPLATPTPSSVGPSLPAASPENPGAGREPRTETEKEIAGSSSSDSAAVVAASPVVEPRVPRPPFS